MFVRKPPPTTISNFDSVTFQEFQDTHKIDPFYYDFAGDSVRNDIYTQVNKHALGKLLQSMYINSGKAYLVLNMSDTIRVTTVDDFKDAGTLIEAIAADKEESPPECYGVKGAHLCLYLLGV